MYEQPTPSQCTFRKNFGFFFIVASTMAQLPSSSCLHFILHTDASFSRCRFHTSLPETCVNVTFLYLFLLQASSSMTAQTPSNGLNSGASPSRHANLRATLTPERPVSGKFQSWTAEPNFVHSAMSKDHSSHVHAQLMCSFICIWMAIYSYTRYSCSHSAVIRLPPPCPLSASPARPPPTPMATSGVRCASWRFPVSTQGNSISTDITPGNAIWYTSLHILGTFVSASIHYTCFLHVFFFSNP